MPSARRQRPNAAAARAAKPGERLPQPVLTLLESRIAIEFASLLLSLPWLKDAPAGDGHPVLLLPGFGASDSSLEPLRLFLRTRGYEVETWGFGRNLGFNRRFANAIEQKVRFMHHRTGGRRVSLVGWSLGGVFAYYAARVAPECVRTAVALGSPLRFDPDHPPPVGLRALYRAFASPFSPETHTARARSRTMRGAPPVPSTCIYSESDALVSPDQATLDGDPADHENIRIPGSHLGLVLNPIVMWLVADRLAQPEGAWRPYDYRGLIGRGLKAGGYGPPPAKSRRKRAATTRASSTRAASTASPASSRPKPSQRRPSQRKPSQPKSSGPKPSKPNPSKPQRAAASRP
jgi:pimeloyl-ACP methyl ester carboxylesterase